MKNTAPVIIAVKMHSACFCHFGQPRSRRHTLNCWLMWLNSAPRNPPSTASPPKIGSSHKAYGESLKVPKVTNEASLIPLINPWQLTDDSHTFNVKVLVAAQKKHFHVSGSDQKDDASSNANRTPPYKPAAQRQQLTVNLRGCCLFGRQARDG